MIKDHIVRLASIRRRTQLFVCGAACAAGLSRYRLAGDGGEGTDGDLRTLQAVSPFHRNNRTLPVLPDHERRSHAQQTDRSDREHDHLPGRNHQEKTTGNKRFVAALNGETFSNTPQEIPGGLSALVDCNEIKGASFPARARRGACKATLENPWLPRSFKAAYETTELAEPASEIELNRNNALFARRDGVVAAGEVPSGKPTPRTRMLHRLEHQPGGTRHDHRDDQPTSHPTSRSAAHPETSKSSQKATPSSLTDVTSVDNSFAAPEATGCGGRLSSLIDPLVNSKIGLPSPAGYNTVIHNGTDEIAAPLAVIASETETEPTKENAHPGEKWTRKTRPRKKPKPVVALTVAHKQADNG